MLVAESLFVCFQFVYLFKWMLGGRGAVRKLKNFFPFLLAWLGGKVFEEGTLWDLKTGAGVDLQCWHFASLSSLTCELD